MNPELQAKLVTYLDGLEKGAAKVGEFAEREIPETIREWLLWLAVEQFTYAAMFLVAAIAAAFVMRRVQREVKQYIASEVGAEPLWFFVVMGWAVVPALLYHTTIHAMQGVKVLVAPRVVIVEKVAELIKK